MSEVDSVLVDVGTGFYMKRNIKQAQGYMQRRLDIVKENLDKIQQMMMNKKKSLDSVETVR